MKSIMVQVEATQDCHVCQPTSFYYLKHHGKRQQPNDKMSLKW